MADAQKKRSARRLSPKLQKAVMDDIRAGILSRKKIAEKHGAPYEAVLAFSRVVGASGDLRAEVIEKAANEAVAIRMADNSNDAVVVNEGAQVVLALVRDHSSQVKRARDMASLLMDDLEMTIRNRIEIERAIEVDTAGEQSPARESQMKRAVSLPTNTKTLADLAGALKTLIGLEREIFNIGKGGEGDDGQSLEDYVLSLDGEATRVQG